MGGYSAQQAELDHRGQKEIVRILVEIELTTSYSAFQAPPSDSSAKSSAQSIPRSDDFWRDFRVQINDGEQAMDPVTPHGRAKFACGDNGPCYLSGATVELQVPSDAFTSDSVTIQVVPPEGAAVAATFLVNSLR